MTATGHTLIETDFGWVGVALGSRGVRAATTPWPSPETALLKLRRLAPEAQPPLPDDVASSLAGAVRAYLAGAASDIGVPLDLVGTPFQLAVWAAVSGIRRGETRSYGWVAASVGRPGAARAVGRAMSTNPIPLMVPCHRVIASGGGIGGYGGGLDAKRALLRAEGVTIAAGAAPSPVAAARRRQYR